MASYPGAVKTFTTRSAGQTIGFVVTGQFGTGNASNKAFLDGFELELA